MRRVILESPFSGDVDGNTDYARRCVRDSVWNHGEAPICSHLLFTQRGILNDEFPLQRAMGIEAGLAWLEHAEAMVVYVDRGISPGMRTAMLRAQDAGILVELRRLNGEMGTA